MIKQEIHLLRSRRIIIPIVVLSVAFLMLATFSYWRSSKLVVDHEIASLVSNSAFQSTTMALFFMIWILQATIHLISCGYYRMMFTFGKSRTQLFAYVIKQVVLYVLLFMILNFVIYAIVGLFKGLAPWVLIINSDINALISQFLFLFLSGIIAVCIGFVRTNHALILPFVIYWFLEGWIAGLIKKKMEVDVGRFFPLRISKQIISDQFLTPLNLTLIALISLFLLVSLNYIIQRKNLA